ncbi:MAG: phosphatase PAP2 family protein [Cyclobacteriaceae bacterium]
MSISNKQRFPNHFLLIGLLSFIISFDTSANSDLSFSDSTKQNPKRNYFGSYLSDAGYLYSAPIRWKAKDWLKFGAFTASGIGLYQLDDNIQQWTLDNRNDLSHDISSGFEKLGNTSSTSIALGGALIVGLITEDEKVQDVTLLALKSSLLSGLLAQTIKNIAHRARPNAGLGKDSWHGPKIGGKHKAWPSGHTTTAFALATTFAQIYKDKKWVPISSYSLATLAGVSRLHDNKHWATDVFAGAVLGYFSAKGILANEKRNNRNFVFAPFYFGEATGISVAIMLN